MDVLLIGSVAFAASLLTFFTGFGLGTLLLPAFAAFFPAQMAVALTAVVHLLNSLFFAADIASHGALLGAVALAAFAGALAGNRLVQSVSLRSIEIGVAVLLIAVATGLGSGVL